jgi:hypothetical protein
MATVRRNVRLKTFSKHAFLESAQLDALAGACCAMTLSAGLACVRYYQIRIVCTLRHELQVSLLMRSVHVALSQMCTESRT